METYEQDIVLKNVCGEGETHLSFTAPTGHTFILVPEPDYSTSIDLRMPNGSRQRIWNNVSWGTCSLFGTGVGMAVTTWTGNPIVGAFAGAFATWNCNQNPPSFTSEDGDAYRPGCN